MRSIPTELIVRKLFTFVNELDLSENQLSKIPNFKMNLLRHLNLNHNNFGKFWNETSSFQHFPEITLLYLSNNSIKQIYDKNFQNLRFLRKLDLSHNKLTAISSSVFKNIGMLEKLGLSFNKLKEIENDTFTLPWLKELDLSFNKLESIGNIFVKVGSMKEFNLNNNILTSFPAKALFGLKSITKISLNNNILKKLSFPVFKFLRNLEIVNNRLRIINLKNISGTLYSLKADNNPFKSVSDWLILPKLRNLSMINCSLTEVPMKLNVSKKLTLANLSWNNIRIIFECELLSLTNLKEINVNVNPIECNCSLAWIKHLNIRFKTKLTCFEPKTLRDKKISDLSFKSLKCGDEIGPYKCRNELIPTTTPRPSTTYRYQSRTIKIQPKPTIMNPNVFKVFLKLEKVKTDIKSAEIKWKSTFRNKVIV